MRAKGDAAVGDIAPAFDQQLDAENRQLRATIDALRGRLEDMQAQTDARVQASLAGAQAEIVQLKATINALRTELEQIQGLAEKNVEDAGAALRDENRQLRDMIVALRAELERKAAA